MANQFIHVSKGTHTKRILRIAWEKLKKDESGKHDGWELINDPDNNIVPGAKVGQALPPKTPFVPEEIKTMLPGAKGGSVIQGDAFNPKAKPETPAMVTVQKTGIDQPTPEPNLSGVWIPSGGESILDKQTSVMPGPNTPATDVDDPLDVNGEQLPETKPVPVPTPTKSVQVKVTGKSNKTGWQKNG